MGVQAIWAGPRGVRREPEVKMVVADRTVIKGQDGETLGQLIVDMPGSSEKVVIDDPTRPKRVNGTWVHLSKEDEGYVLSMKRAGQ
jgi:hypothetical protein